jgi:hypothetical protein
VYFLLVDTAVTIRVFFNYSNRAYYTKIIKLLYKYIYLQRVVVDFFKI